MTGITARTSRNTSDAAVNSGLVRQTISRKGRRFLKAPTRSLKDWLDGADGPIVAEPEEGRVSRPPWLVCRGIQRPGLIGLGLHVVLESRHGQLRSKPRPRDAGKAWRRQVLETFQPQAADRKKESCCSRDHHRGVHPRAPGLHHRHIGTAGSDWRG